LAAKWPEERGVKSEMSVQRLLSYALKKKGGAAGGEN